MPQNEYSTADERGLTLINFPRKLRAWQRNWCEYKIMNERPADKLWKDLTPEQVNNFFKLLAKRADDQEDLAYKTLFELAKYLFAASTGAAAGLLFLLKSSPGHLWYLLSFFAFCAGTFFVGVSFHTLTDWSRELADGSTQDLNAWGRNEITVAGMDTNNRARYASCKKTVARWGLRVSFCFLLVGGLMTAFALWNYPAP